MLEINVNGKMHSVDVEPDTPLLWVLREQVGLTGTKYGCGIAQCGSCTVMIDGEAVRSKLNKLQQAWVEHQVPQCGYCQSGMLMAVTELLRKKPQPTDADIDSAITNICRCGTFQQVRAAIHSVAKA